MKRAVIFAHYDKNREIKDYVLYYLKELKKTADTIIFVSCCDLKNACCLNGLADKIIAEQHNEYDFGSYKRGFLLLFFLIYY